jgi:rRNA-processing protein FCF1
VKVLADSNFLMAAIQFRVDIIHELERLLGGRTELVLISPVEEELKAIASGHQSKRSIEASRALDFALGIPVEAVPRLLRESVDDVIVRVSKERGWAVATNDRRLRKRLGELAVPTIYLRQRTHLEAKGIIE